MKHFEKYLLEQLQMHPSAQPQDVVKLCYQAAFGAEHLLKDVERAKKYLEEEFEATESRDIPLYEPVSADICRVNLAAWKFHELPVEWLFGMLTASPFEAEEGKTAFREYLQAAGKIVRTGAVGFSAENWQSYLAEYEKTELSPVHHSQQYREKELPAYRVVSRKYMDLIPILEQAAERLQEKDIVIIAIDGRAASGKTTTAAQLQKMIGADVVQMDDFFLPLELRTAERLGTPGGNVHHERFSEEVLPFLSLGEEFSYRIFDCSQMDYNGRRTIGGGKIRIVEGSYSCHPVFGEYADIRVFSDVDGEEQLNRIRERNGEQMAEIFRDRWIPMEEAYFQAYEIAEKADIRLDRRS